MQKLKILTTMSARMRKRWKRQLLYLVSASLTTTSVLTTSATTQTNASMNRLLTVATKTPGATTETFATEWKPATRTSASVVNHSFATTRTSAPTTHATQPRSVSSLPTPPSATMATPVRWAMSVHRANVHTRKRVNAQWTPSATMEASAPLNRALATTASTKKWNATTPTPAPPTPANRQPAVCSRRSSLTTPTPARTTVATWRQA